DNNVAIAHGPSMLHGCDVVAHDLRGGAALILAGLAAEGETLISNGYYIDRGHATLAQRFAAVGGDVTPEEHEISHEAALFSGGYTPTPQAPQLVQPPSARPAAPGGPFASLGGPPRIAGSLEATLAGSLRLANTGVVSFLGGTHLLSRGLD